MRREQARKRALRLLLSRFFENSAEQLVQNVLKNEKRDAAELRRLRRMIEEAMFARPCSLGRGRGLRAIAGDRDVLARGRPCGAG